MISALLIVEWCTPCQAKTDHELNTVACQTECQTCAHTENVSEFYVTQQLAADETEWSQ